MRFALVVLPLCAWFALVTTIRADEPAEAKLKKLAEESRTRAAAIEVTLKSGERDTKTTLHPEPIMKYTDVPRQIEMATLWVWQDDGRPVALGKVEGYDRPGGTKWLYCFASASTGTVEAKWSDGHRFQAKKAGVEWVALGEPAPRATAAGRLRQMKELVQRFTVTARDDVLKTSDDLRPLTRPLHEYSAPKKGVVQGVLCGFAANGTNPDVIVAVEAVADDKGAAKSWRYALIPMTAGGISVKLDKTEVFTRAYARNPADFETWTYFWEGMPKK